MNQPTREEFERLEEEQRQLKAEQEQLKEEFRKLKEQQTEPIRITRLEIDSGSMQDSIEKINKQLDAVQEDTNTVKVEIQGVRSDILLIKATQSDHSAFHIEHGQRLKTIEDKQDAHSEVLDKLVDFAESHEKNMATKDDLKAFAESHEKNMATKDDLKATETRLIDAMRAMLKGE